MPLLQRTRAPHGRDGVVHDRNGHDHGHGDHGHSHGLVDDSIKRSREGVRAVLVSLGILGCAALAQTLIYALRARSRCWPTSSTTSATR